MPTPTRPTTGGPVESSWGQEVHDGIFMPTGGRWHSQNASIGDANDIALVKDDDPGNWLAAAGGLLLTVPADSAGYYHASALFRPSVVEANRLYRAGLKVNGTQKLGNTAYVNATVTDWTLEIAGTILLAVGNTIALYLPGGTGTGRFSLEQLVLSRAHAGFAP